jgi:hypothetical protein
MSFATRRPDKRSEMFAEVVRPGVVTAVASDEPLPNDPATISSVVAVPFAIRFRKLSRVDIVTVVGPIIDDGVRVFFIINTKDEFCAIGCEEMAKSKVVPEGLVKTVFEARGASMTGLLNTADGLSNVQPDHVSTTVGMNTTTCPPIGTLPNDEKEMTTVVRTPGIAVT